MTHLIALAMLWTAAPAEPVPGQERIASIALAGSGQAGTIVTTPVLLGGERTAYEFGRGACKAHRLQTEVVEQLLAAMRGRSPVKIDAIVVGRGDTEARCITGVTFFAPDA